MEIREWTIGTIWNGGSGGVGRVEMEGWPIMLTGWLGVRGMGQLRAGMRGQRGCCAGQEGEAERIRGKGRQMLC